MPHQETSVDEAKVAFCGRLSFKEYLPAKPTKYGIKIWCRADSTNGYLNDFQVYTGRDGKQTEVGLGGRVVLDLTKDIPGKYHIMNMDNFFTSSTLFYKLFADKLLARGTVTAN